METPPKPEATESFRVTIDVQLSAQDIANVKRILNDPSFELEADAWLVVKVRRTA